MSTGQLLRAIAASEKREKLEQQRQRALGKELATTIAKRKKIIIGQQYYVLPLGMNGRDGRKFPAEVIAVDRYWKKGERGREISVLLKFYNRNGAFKTEWVTTENNEFTSLKARWSKKS